MNLGNNNHNGDHMQATSAPYGAGMPAYSMRPHSASNPLPPGYGYASAMQNGLYSGVKPEEQHGGNYASQSGQMQGGWGHMFSNNTNNQDGFMAQQQQQQQHQQQHQHQQQQQQQQQQAQQQQHEQSGMPVKPEHAVENQSYGTADGHNDSFLNGLYSQPTAYADEAAR